MRATRRRTINYEREYDNRGRVPEHPAIIDGWYTEAAAFRQRQSGEFDLAYGDHPREKLDLFRPPRDAGRPALLFIHGGYWQALDKNGFSHLAAGMLAHDVPVAVAGYPLCPEVPIAFIVEAIRKAVLLTAERTGRRVVVAGHSAGGHLAAAMLATDWSNRSADADLVPSALAISGLFDLEPLTHTSVNAALRLDVETARALSPLYWPVARDRRLDAWVGAHESDAYHRQSVDVVRVWGEAGVDTEYHVVTDADHFRVIQPLVDPTSPLTTRLASFCTAAPLA